MQHLRNGEVELGFFVLLVAGEFLADVVAEVVFEVCRAVRTVGRDLLTEGHKVAAGYDLAERVFEHSRAAELVGHRPS